ncbi:uncharacterized protein FA14DRAFT_160704 [Meira miltonrushii]|uniref:Uncharacterized protein n=1 Tax=Meira miltonrushii TaxID=1280837 RepID=A0A316VF10_9BASI|nr:uncharacterized protein FA14DRAFT_160704 [Meira miltonrushii]PWN35648.1 hypothetical protein FA14DRAFT_160704 [Meira miltonrushii]
METWNYSGNGATSQNGLDNPGESSRNTFTHRTQLPSRRRQLGGMPLHPSRRPPPSHIGSGIPISSSFMPTLSSPLRMSESTPEPSVFLTPNSISRKRSHFTASANLPSNDNIYNPEPYQQSLDSHSRRSAHIHHSPMDAPDLGDSSVLSYGSIPTGSPTNKYGSWSRKTGSLQTSHFSEPQTSQPLRPPQGEFSFQAQAPSFFQSSVNHTETSTSLTNEQQGETSSMAFARLAQAQRQQQEARRLAASGANDAPESGSADDHTDGPPVKKRRGVASTIVDGALSAALYTGAAALTAYSLWSSWGRKEESGEEASGAQDNEGLAETREKLPPGALEEPPPPYTIAGSSKGSGESPMKNGRPVHVFVSSRRRRPVFATHRSSKNASKRRLSALNDLAQQSPSVMSDSTSQQEDGDDDDDDDEMFRRFQSKMSNLIEEGTRALNSEADLSAMDLEDDDDYSFQSARFSPSKSDSRLVSGQPLSPSRLPRSQTTAFTFGNEALKRPQNTPNLFNSHSSTFDVSTSTANSPRSPFLSLASRDPNSPYGRISRPGSVITSPTLTARKRLH